MMIEKYNCEIDDKAVLGEFRRLINQIYKLLPMREEGTDWQRPLQTIIEEIAGMNRLFGQHDRFFPLLCKLEGLFTLTEEEDFPLYRGAIFEILGIMNELCQDLT